MPSLCDSNTNGFEVPKHQQKKAEKAKKAAKAKAEAAKANEATPTASINPTKEAKPLPVINGKAVDTSKDGWQLKLTIPEMKEFKAQEALAEHNELYPPKPKAKPVLNRSGTRPIANNSGNTNASSSGAQRVTNGSTRPVRNTDAGGQRIAPCGIPGCPVMAQHESRIYAINDPFRPQSIKAIQAKGNKIRSVEWGMVESLFDLHREYSAQANKERAEAQSRA